MPHVKETKESKANARRLEEGKKQRGDKGKQRGAGFQGQANALKPGSQPGFDARHRL